MPKKYDENAFTKLKRLHRLVEFLMNKKDGGATFENIADKVYEYDSRSEELDTVRRKFHRDIKDLKNLYDETDDTDVDEQSVVISKKYTGREYRYYIKSGFHFMLPMKLSADQAAALAFGLRITEEILGPFSGSSGDLWGKFKGQFSDDFIDKSDKLMNSVVSCIPVSMQEKRSAREDVMRKVADAIQRGKVIKIGNYIDRDGSKSSCKLSPYVLFLRYHSWYVMGESSDKKDKEQPAFRLDRMQLVEVLDEDQPRPCIGKDLDELKKNIRLDCNLNRPDDKYNVRLMITGSFVQPCMQTEWFPGERKRPQKDGSLLYEAELRGLEAVTLWIMRALDCIEVLEPAELRDEIDRRVDEYCARRSARK